VSFPGEVKLKALIVEDNASYREIIKDTLTTLFPTIIIQEASEGKEAIQKVGVFQPQLIFMDIRLPGENGLHLTERIKASHPDTKVIILTGYDSPEYEEASTRCGANGYLPKDCLNPAELQTLIKSLVE
jgi:DNA-binding NarL/FixJ family response regulator